MLLRALLLACASITCMAGFGFIPRRLDTSAKTLLLIRHGQTEMNVALDNHVWGSKNFVDVGKWDTVLTATGMEQAKTLRSKMAGIVDQIDVVISSPLSRALHTSELVFGDSIAKEKKIVHPLLTERVYLSSDVGKQREALQNIYPNWNYDSLPDNSDWWYSKQLDAADYHEWRPTPATYLCAGEPVDVFKPRMVALKAFLEAREEKCIAIVSHWGVIRSLTKLDPRNCELNIISIDALQKEPFVDNY